VNLDTNTIDGLQHLDLAVWSSFALFVIIIMEPSRWESRTRKLR
jgi:hypothetical protein